MADADRGRHDELTPDNTANTASREAAEEARHDTVPRDTPDAGARAAGQANVPNEEDEETYRAHYEGLRERPADRAYNDYRAGYWLGHLARRNPDYAGRRFEDIEPELERGWSDELRRRYGDWAGMRGYARAAYEREERGRSGDPEDRKGALQDPLPEDGS